MSTGGDEIIVRLTAEDAGLKSGMDSAAASVVDANAMMADSAKAAQDAITAASQSAVDAEAAAAARIKDMVASSIAEMNAMVSAASAAPQVGTLGAMGGNAQALSDYAALNAIMNQTAATSDDLAAQEAALDRLMASNAISAKTYADALAALNEREMAMVAASQAAAESFAQEAAAREALGATILGYTEEVAAAAAAEQVETDTLAENTVAKEANASASRSMGSSMRMPMGMFGLMTRGLQAMQNPLVAAGVGMVALGADAVVQADRVDQLRGVLLATGDAAGVSADQLDIWAETSANVAVTIGDAQKMYEQLAMSGVLAGQELQQAGQAASDMAMLTGESAKQAAQAVIAMATNPQTAIMQLNQKFNFLSESAREQVQRLLDSGDSADALRIAFDQLAEHEHEAALKFRDDAHWYSHPIDAIENAMDALGRTTQLATGFGTLPEQLQSLKNQLAAAQIDHAHGAGNSGEIAFLQKKVDAINAEIDAENRAAKAKNTHFIMPVAGFGKDALAADENAMKQAEALQQMSYQHRIAYEQQFWQHMLQTATKGSAEYMAAYQHLQGMGAKMPKASKAHALAQDDAQQLRLLEAEENVSDAKRLSFEKTFWDQKIATATKGSREWQRATVAAYDVQKRMDHEAAQAAKEATARMAEQMKELSAIDRRAAAQMAAMTTAAKDAAIAAAFDSGKMTPQQEGQALTGVEDQKYGAQLQSYNAQIRPAVAANDYTQIATLNAQIEAEMQQHQQRLVQIQRQTVMQSSVLWKQLGKDITNAIGTSVQGVIMGTETTHQAMRHMAASILAEMVSSQAQVLVTVIETQMGMTSATAAGTASRLALEEAASIRSTMIHAEAAIKWIITEGAKAAAATIAAFAQMGPWGVAAGIAAAAAVTVEVMHMAGSVASASGGWERVPADGMMTELHKDEQVLPAGYAEGLRKLVANGGSGQQVVHHHHYSIQAWDGRSMKDTLRRNPHLLADAARHASRNGAAL